MIFPTSERARWEVLERARELWGEAVTQAFLARKGRELRSGVAIEGEELFLQVGDSWVATQAARDKQEELRNRQFWRQLFQVACQVYRHQAFHSCHIIVRQNDGRPVIAKVFDVGIASTAEDLRSGKVEFLITERERERLVNQLPEGTLHRVQFPISHPWRLTVRLGYIVRITV
ncbi:MAG: hypothetical protein HY978_01090 [Candidatus Liptonbacteria bacterium]|nr:hypothetical protein [Candidatus Liptonbacteria bacterium]